MGSPAPKTHPRERVAPAPDTKAQRLVDFLTGHPTTTDPSLGIAGRIGTPTGQTLGDGRYRVLRVRGEGSNAIVYEAADTRLSSSQSEAVVAVKVARTETEAQQQLDEARNARRVQHPNVVRILDCGVTDDGRAFTVQELVSGTTLEQHPRARTNRARRRLVGLFVQAAEGLEAIHAAGLVHCDIKPANLLIASDGTLKVTDFGAATGCAPQAAFTEATPSSARGTLAFMAPELFRLDRESFMPSSDLFSLGATLFWALTGKPPAGEDAAETICTLDERGGLKPDRIDRSLREAGVDRDLRAIVGKTLSPLIHERYGSAGVLAGDLRAWTERRPIESTRPSAWSRASLLCRRRPVAMTAAVLALAGSVSAAAALEHSRRVGAASAAQAAELAIERAGREADAAWRARAIDSLQRLMSGFRAAKEQGLAAEVLTSLWVLEWAHGPTLLQDPEALGALWSTRIETIEAVRAQAQLDAGPDSLEARLTEPSLALWLLRAGRDREARAILAEAIPYWQQHATDGDPWLEQLRVLDSVAVSAGLQRTAAERSLTPSEAAELAAHESRLTAALQRLDDNGDRSPIAQLLRDAAE